MSDGIYGRFERFFAFVGYTLVSLILAAVVIELGAHAVWAMKHGLRPSSQEKLGSTSPAYASYPWAAEFWKEEQARRKPGRGGYVPFVVWGVSPWSGKYVNNDVTELGVVRRTTNPARSGCEKNGIKSVWMFGGSTLYGSGVPDWATLPSYMATALNSTGGPCFAVINFGVEGYNTNQEVILLSELLKRGHRPDTVIFYDGFNDSYVGAFAPGNAGDHWEFDAIKARVDGKLVGKLDFLRNSYALRLAREIAKRRSPSGEALLESRKIESRAAATISNYQQNIAFARKLSGTYGFTFYAFWQPALPVGHKPLAGYEQDLVTLDANSPEGSAFPGIIAVYRLAQDRAARDGDFIYLGDIFDGVGEPLYLDRWNHLGPRGNELAAAAVAKYLPPLSPQK